MPWDVFLSYSHVDDRAPPGWVKRLHTDLDYRLRAIAPTLNASIWADFVDLPGAGDLNVHIAKAIADSKVLLCVVSPTYVLSSQCLKELGNFMSKGHVGPPKILQVVKLPVAIAQLPDALQRSRGCIFHDQARNAVELTGTAYDVAVAHLAFEVRDLVEQARRRASKRVVVLASDDRQTDRERTRTELMGNGYEVMPAGALPAAVKSRQAELRELLGLGDFSVLLLGNDYSTDIDYAHGQLVNLLGASPPVRCLASMPRETAANSDYQKLVERIKNSGAPFDYVIAQNDVSHEVLGLLKDLDLVTSQQPTVYLRYWQQDKLGADQVRVHIPQPPFTVLDVFAPTSPATTDTRAHDESIQRAHGILVYVDKTLDLLATTLNDLRRAVDRLIALYVPNPAIELPEFARAYPVVYPDGVVAAATAGGRSFSLAQFLAEVQRRAGPPGPGGG